MCKEKNSTRERKGGVLRVCEEHEKRARGVDHAMTSMVKERPKVSDHSLFGVYAIRTVTTCNMFGEVVEENRAVLILASSSRISTFSEEAS